MRRLDELADRTLALLGQHAPAAEALVTVHRSRHGLTRFANSYVHQHVGEDVTRIQLTLHADGRTLNTFTSNLRGDDDLDRFVAEAVAHAALLPRDRDWPGVNGPQDPPVAANLDQATWDAEPATRAELVQAFIEADPDLRSAGYLDTDGGAVVHASTAGLRVSGQASRATIDGIHQTATSAGFAHGTSHRLGDLDAGAAGTRAAALARSAADARDVSPGTYTVVLSPDCVAEMVAFLGFYGFNAKEEQEGQSFVQLGAQQFDPAIQLVDDATDPRAVGLRFDHDGTPKRPTPLIEDGVTRQVVHDRRTAARAGTTSTGHAIPGGDAWGAFPQNLFLRGGDQDHQQLVAGVRRGLLVTSFNYCRILDPKSQVVTGLTRNGTFLIEDGEPTTAVSNLRFTQSFVEALAPGNVDALGSDARFAASEFGEGVVHCPSVRLHEFRFTGGAAG